MNKQEIKGFENFYMESVLVSIKVNFRNGSWIRVFQRKNEALECY